MKFSITALVLLFLLQGVYAQEDLLSLLEEEAEPEINFTPASFKGSRLINGHTIMTRKKGSLEFIIAHRFGRINSGAYELFGLDNSNIRFGLDYGVSDRLTIGIGRNSFEKTYDAFGKFALLRQQYGKQDIPVSLTLFASTSVQTLKNSNPEFEIELLDRLAYTYQLLLARKFNEAVSLQLMPTFVHFNAVEASRQNDLAALGVGGRMKVSKRISVNAEYYYRFSERTVDDAHDSIALGVDIETGGHVFQFQLTNSRAMIEKGFIRETSGHFFEGDIHFGFNITRTF